MVDIEVRGQPRVSQTSPLPPCLRQGPLLLHLASLMASTNFPHLPMGVLVIVDSLPTAAVPESM